MKIYTKTGDLGETGLFGGERVSKNSLRIEAYGTVDELNSVLGLAATEVKGEGVKELLEKIQNELFTMGSDLATPDTEKNKKLNVPRISDQFSLEAEQAIDHYNSLVPPLTVFVLPGGTKSASLLHLARTVCRRAERRVVAVNMAEQINKNIVIFLNRLSDLFFVLARYENFVSGVADIAWKK
jgi:ATP:cob(I)alamin adenosyltransferase